MGLLLVMVVMVDLANLAVVVGGGSVIVVVGQKVNWVCLVQTDSGTWAVLLVRRILGDRWRFFTVCAWDGCVSASEWTSSLTK